MPGGKLRSQADEFAVTIVCVAATWSTLLKVLPRDLLSVRSRILSFLPRPNHTDLPHRSTTGEATNPSTRVVQHTAGWRQETRVRSRGTRRLSHDATDLRGAP